MVSFYLTKKSGFLKCFFSSILVITLILTISPSPAFAAESTPFDNWTKTKINFTANAVTYGNGAFIAVGNGGKIATSSDGGASWTYQTQGTADTNFTGVTCNGSTIAISGYEQIYTVIKKKKYFDHYDSIILISTDNGATWTKQTPNFSRILCSITYINDTFVVLGDGGLILTSKDGGTTWVSQTSGVTTQLNAVTYGNGKFVVVGINGTILTSEDGVTWTQQTSGNSKYLSSVAFGNNTFVTGDSWGNYLTSPDGIAWTSYKLNTGNSGYNDSSSAFSAIVYGNNYFVAVDDNEMRILTSTNGIDWVSHDTGHTASEVYNDIAYGDYGFCIVGDKISRRISFKPTISMLDREYGPESGGTPVKILGTNLNLVSKVYFNDTEASFTLNEDNSISAISPAGTGEACVSIEGPGSYSTYYKYPFTYGEAVIDLSGSTVTTGQTVTFTAKTSGIEPVEYYWIKDCYGIGDDEHIKASIKSPILTIEGTQVSDSGKYICVVYTEEGYVESQEVVLTVNPIGAVIESSNRSFNIDKPSDVDTDIIWGDATTVTNLVCNSKILVSPDDYIIAGNKLKIKKEFLISLSLLENATADIIISFDTGNSATLKVTAVKKYSLSVNAGVGGSVTTGSSGDYKAGTPIAIKASPSPGYIFNGWTSTGGGTFVNASKEDTIYTMPSNEAAITANFTYAGSPGDNGGGGGIDTPVIIPPVQEPKVETRVSGNTITASTATSAAVDSKGKAKAEVTQEQVSKAVNKAAEEATKQGANKQAVLEIKVEAETDAKAVETSLPKTAVDTIADSKTNALTIATPIADITFDDKSLKTIAGQATEDLKISAVKVETAALSEDTRQLVGDRPVYNFSVTSGNNTISQFGGSITVAVPYTPKPGEDTDAVVIYYINAQGKPEIVSNCKYDAVTGTVSFTTNHFSQYAVGYNKVSFKDVPQDAWYSSAVRFIAARGISTGTGNGNFAPAAKLTRGEFLVMMMRAYGIEPSTDSPNNFSDAGNTFYTGYLAKAKQLGITGGVGNNMFAPNKEITRQEMFTLLYNTLKVAGNLPEGNSGKQLTSFTDAGQIASWAKDSVALLVETGIISGNGSMISPLNTVTRGEMAQVLYNLLLK